MRAQRCGVLRLRAATLSANLSSVTFRILSYPLHEGDIAKVSAAVARVTHSGLAPRKVQQVPGCYGISSIERALQASSGSVPSCLRWILLSKYSAMYASAWKRSRSTARLSLQAFPSSYVFLSTSSAPMTFGVLLCQDKSLL